MAIKISSEHLNDIPIHLLPGFVQSFICGRSVVRVHAVIYSPDGNPGTSRQNLVTEVKCGQCQDLDCKLADVFSLRN